MLSNIEKINAQFKIPIIYNNEKIELNSNIITDLELIKTIDPSCNSMYEFTFQPKTVFGKKILEQYPSYYTTDISFLKDNQSLLKNYKSTPDEIFKPDYENIIELWDNIKNETGFKEKYQYIDWPFWEKYNKNDLFLQILSIYNLSSPVLSLLFPLIILVIPFFVIQAKGISLTFTEYVNILKIIASNHAIGRLFTKFNSVKIDEKMYMLVSAFFYIFSIYQNILTCIRFNSNMKKIHIYLNDVKTYIQHTENNTQNFLSYSSDLPTFSTFNQKLKENMNILKEFKEKIEKISPYKFTINKIFQFGYILKCFYELYDDKIYNDAFLYSFGFNGYIDTLEGFINNIKNKNLNFAKFKKFKKNKKNSAKFVDFYYPALINKKPIHNSINIDKNLIITGPNASGKTTILKSSLINIILTQQMGCGFYSSGTLTPYKHIHCYLNIPDTSGRDSLFQAEARRCKEIIDAIHSNPGENHFCVFDELYSGTNPDEAVSSAKAFMKYLAKYKNVNCLLTTHFLKLCTHLENNKNFKNFHMETMNNGEKYQDFDYTYLLKKGISNVRGGIKVLEDMNYPKEIIDDSFL